MTSLSVIIITKNEEKNIKPCLESVRFADEIILLDSGSTDNTIAIAQQFTPHVHRVDWPGFGIQKNRALEMCQYEWVLSLDADEQLTTELQHEIQQIIKSNPQSDAFLIPRKSSYCGKWIRYGDWRNDYCLRLFRRTKARFKELPIHEKLIVAGSIKKTKSYLLHASFPDLETVLNKMNCYSSLSATYKHTQGQKGNLSKAIFHAMWTFVRGYCLRLGFLDGKTGFMLAISNAEGCYYRYLKIMLMNQASQQTKF